MNDDDASRSVVDMLKEQNRLPKQMVVDESPAFFDGSRPDCVIFVTHVLNDLTNEQVLGLLSDVGKPLLFWRHRYKHRYHHNYFMFGFDDPCFVVRAFDQLDGYSFFGNTYAFFYSCLFECVLCLLYSDFNVSHVFLWKN